MRIFRSKIWRGLFWPLSLIFLTATKIRNQLFDRSIRRSTKVDACVISVGNISVGGTGKTPVIDALAKILQANGMQIALLSRGYGRKSRGVVIVSNGSGPQCPVEMAGDEPYMLASRLAQIPVVVAEDRVAGAQEICRLFAPEIILLDDGFQHRQLWRDFDLVLIDAVRLLQNRSLLPAGPYREGLRSLARAEFLLLVNNGGDHRAAKKVIAKKSAIPVFTCAIDSKQVFYPNSNTRKDFASLRKEKIMAFCGIGQPEKLRHALENIQAEIISFHAFKDHQEYSEKLMDDLLHKFNNSSATILVTTEKDWVKIHKNKSFQQLRICIPDHRASFSDKFISEFMQRLREHMKINHGN